MSPSSMNMPTMQTFEKVFGGQPHTPQPGGMPPTSQGKQPVIFDLSPIYAAGVILITCSRYIIYIEILKDKFNWICLVL